MKKFLLILTLVAIACSSASAAGKLLKKDPNGYETVNGISMRNLWLLDRFHYGVNELQTDYGWCNVYARTATIQDGIVYIARTGGKTIIMPNADGGNDTISAAVVYRYDAFTGEEMPPLDITLNGEPYSGGTLGANNIGKDNFGHVWLAPYTSELAAAQPIYQLNVETGEITLIASLDKGTLARVDYIDLIGDLTLQEAECNIMGPGSQVPTVFAWHNDQYGDADTWEGFYAGDPYYDFVEFYPESQTQWGYAPASRFILDEDEDSRYSGNYFYIDGFTTVPTLYMPDGSIIDGFGSLSQEELDADSLLMPKVGTNGVAEFKLGDRNFIVYSIGQYDDPNTCQVNICELGEGMAFNGMQRYWTFPADGQGQTSDTGTRMHCLVTDYTTEGGKEAAIVLEFKCYNGIGVYLVGEGVVPDEPMNVSVPGDVNGDGEVTAADITALYNFLLNNDDASIVNGDQTGDDIITSADITAVYNILLGS